MKSTIESLNKTLTAYCNFRKPGRYVDLKAKRDPTEGEKARMAEIEKIEELKRFLPKD